MTLNPKMKLQKYKPPEDWSPAERLAFEQTGEQPLTPAFVSATQIANALHDADPDSPQPSSRKA